MTARHLTTHLLLSASLLVALAGCATAPTATPSPTDTACASAGSDTEAVAVSAAALCERDGKSWTDSAFTLVMNTPGWRSESPACDDARQNAWWTAWKDAQGAIETIDLGGGDEGAPNGLGQVGIAVLDEPDATAVVSAIDAEVDACLAEGCQSALTSGDWRGVFGPTSQGGANDERWTWWLAVDDRWALVQASALNEASEADVAEFEDALQTVLAAQQERLERD
jgi:hypothetical protein